MTYKTKSLIYFACFFAACLFYYGIEEQENFTNQLDSKTFVEADYEDVDELLEETQNDFEEDQK
ncbi:MULTISPECIES: hypothetical protein [Flavobacteriaceae]|uniref:hypothetical protein n=1 Tax=Flavobacteriaceae TaxID=49546 RepID=UPI001490BDEA|nr:MULTISPECIES: hypothetical protein [Allomuricauda]MDC6365709.1 hypothetical protein [Muricauda sp. AC10]